MTNPHLKHIVPGISHFVTFSHCLTFPLSHFLTFSLSRFRILSLCLFASLSLCHFTALAQLTFNTSLSANQLAQTLAGPGVIVMNATSTCPAGATGSFGNGATTNIGISNGIILTSGDAAIAQGPDNSDGAGIDNAAAGDADLDALAGANTFDACVLEFDMVPLCDTISFQYVFGSEEYLEFVNAGYNDAFAFFISGPGFGSPTNIAIVPGTVSTPVSIDNVNDVSFSQYYVDNEGGASIQYDGFTTVLDATAVVQPCQTYHMKIVIADAGDGILDSGVFLEQNSLQCGFVTTVDALENSIESCGDSGLYSFCRPTADAFPLTINYTIAGTATNGTDYQTIPSSVTIPANQTCTTLVVIPIQDAIVEGNETIRIIYQPGPCPVMDTTILIINEDATIDPGPGVTFCSGDSALIGPPPQSGWTYSWSPVTGLSNPNSAQTYVSLINNGSTNSTQTYTLNADMGPCNASGTVVVTVTPGPDASFTAPATVCTGQPVSFTNNSVPFQTCVGFCPGPPPFCICTDNPTNYFWDFGNSATSTVEDPTYTYPTAGTYTATLTMTDISTGCGGTATQNITVQSSGTLTLTVSPNGSVCSGQPYTITVSGATTYSWTSNPAGFTSSSSTISVTPSVTTTYLVTGTSGCGSGNEDVIVTVGSSLTVSSIKTDITCNGLNNGSITLSQTGGNSPFTYNWSPNISTGNIASNLGAGNYSATVTDATGCSGVESITIAEPFALAISSSTVPILCFGDSTGNINITVSGGMGIYTYQWSNLLNSEDISAIPAGNYSVTVMDGNSCTLISNFTITEPAEIAVSFTSVQPACGDSNGSVTVAASGGVSPYTYSWSPPGPNSNTIANVSAGGYRVTVTDFNNCTVSDSLLLTSTGNLQATLVSYSDVSCSGGSDGTATVSANGTPPYTYLWVPSLQAAATATGLQAGIQTVFIFDSAGCTTGMDVTLSEPSPMVITGVSTDASCFGSADGAIDITVSGATPGYTFTWSDNSTNEDLSAAAGAYTVTVTDSNLCLFTFSGFIGQPAAMVLSTTSLPATCGLSDGSVAVSVTGGTGSYSYFWTPGGATTPIVANLPADIYLVSVTDSNGCSQSGIAIITNPGAPSVVVSAFSDISCFGNSDGSVTVNASGGKSPYTYQWNTTPPQSGPVATGLAPGSLIVTVTDSAGCVVTLDTLISEPAIIVVSAYGSDTLCGSDSIAIGANALGGTLPYTFLWDNNLGQGPVKKVLPAATTTYTVIVLDANGCTGLAQSVTIVTGLPLVVSITGTTSVCEGDTSVLTASGGGGNGGPYLYTWSNGSSGNSISAAPLTTTTYSVTIADNCGSPSAIASIPVTVQPVLLLSPPSAQGCPGESFTLSANGALTYWWSTESAPSASIGTGSSVVVSPAVSTAYLVHGFDGVCEAVATVPVLILPPPIPGFTSNPDTVFMLNPVILFSDSSSDDVTSWQWDFGDQTSGTLENPLHRYNDTGTFTVKLIVFNSAGCADSITGTIRIIQDFMLFMPSAFTPNGDGKNEFLLPVYIGINKKFYRFYIYDRWGDLIFQSNDPEVSWNGKANQGSKEAQQDVYVWVIDARDMSNKMHHFVGHVTLVK